ncbi:ZIP family metal transporter [Massilia sp. PAMC28688]|uniref:ZIP family metal transporter n=1 Tax=Massilia sp. PAMC28688 TaxID=2861283 RepID=UPI001C632D03|nr:ZIP family metal transporter [Massilia sp. PAMC28688]QYF93681.1 ZIP family metal transporter [Massilia sp. PAMC28688]
MSVSSNKPTLAAGRNQPAVLRGIGLFALLAGLLFLIGKVIGVAPQLDVRVGAALTGGAIAAAATALGTLPVLFAQNYSQRTYDAILGFGGGVMLGATAFSLIVPALDAARAGGASDMVSSLTVGIGVIAGALLILVLDKVISHRSGALADKNHGSSSLKHAWIFVGAVALHNVPEGLAIGVAFAGPDLSGARSLATAISIQDVPEGLVVALALRTVGYGRCASAALGAASGLVEPMAAVFGVVMISLATQLLPFGLALAAGAMLFVIVHSVIPESQRNGHGTAASIALTLGFTLMTVLDTALG